jgi:peptidoglycan/xylan/chitin deacetylase (PgdA/CDA1 family)
MRFVITVDDAGLNQPVEVERRSIAYFDRHGVPASFFVVPCGAKGDLASDPAWVARARQYEAAGHDYQLHGCTHSGFEFGPPPWWMVQICGPRDRESAAAGYPGHRDGWTTEALRLKFDRGIAAFERAFERRPEVFRAGCLAADRPALDVMADAGLRFDSNRVIDPRGWEYIAQRFDTPQDWDPAVPPRPYWITDRVVEIPTVSEYAWTLSDATLHHFIRLAHEDMRRVSEAGGVFVIMCHQQRVGGANDLPRKVLDAILDEARRAHRADFLTLRALAGLIDSGETPVAPAPVPGGCPS